MNISDCEVRALTESISGLTHELRELRKDGQIRDELKKGLLAIETKLAQMDENMAIKLSELKTEVAGIREQVKKIWGEQQAKYDNLVIEFDKLKASLDNVELPPDVETDLTEFKAELKAFDDTIPDTTT